MITLSIIFFAYYLICLFIWGKKYKFRDLETSPDWLIGSIRSCTILSVMILVLLCLYFLP